MKQLSSTNNKRLVVIGGVAGVVGIFAAILVPGPSRELHPTD